MSGTVSPIRIPITAVDRATAVINQVNKSINGLQQPTTRFSRSVNQIDTFGVNRLTQGMSSLGSTARGALGVFERLAPVLGGLTAVTSLAGIGLLTQRFASMGQQLSNIGQRLAMPVSQLTSFQNAGRRFGITADEMTGGLTALDEKLRSATFRGDAVAIQTFAKLGVNFGEIGHRARTAGDAFEEVAAGIKRVNDQEGRGAALRATQNLGMEGLFPFLLQGRSGITALRAEVRKLGNEITPEMLDRSVQLQGSYWRLAQSVEGFTNKLGSGLAPVMKRQIDAMADLIASNSTWISQDIGWAVTKFSDALRSITWDSANKGAGTFSGWLNQIHDKLEMQLPDWLRYKLNPDSSPRTPFGAENNPEVGGGGVRSQSSGEQISWLERQRRKLFGEPDALPATTSPDSRDTSWGKFKLWLDRHIQPGTYESGPFGTTPRPFSLPSWTHLQSGNYLSPPPSRPWHLTSAPGLNPDIERQVRLDARMAGLDEEHMVALFRTEHGGFANVSPAGAFGPSQLMPGTAKGLGLPTSPNDLHYDWRQNVMGGISYYRQQLDRYGNYQVADAAYNAGPDNQGVKLFGRTGQRFALPDETNKYIDTIERTAGGSGGTVTVSIDAKGLPAGSSVKATSSGIAKVATPMVAFPLMGF